MRVPDERGRWAHREGGLAYRGTLSLAALHAQPTPIQVRFAGVMREVPDLPDGAQPHERVDAYPGIRLHRNTDAGHNAEEWDCEVDAVLERREGDAACEAAGRHQTGQRRPQWPRRAHGRRWPPDGRVLMPRRRSPTTLSPPPWNEGRRKSQTDDPIAP